MRAFLHITEAVLAITLMILALNQAQTNIASASSDYSGTARLRGVANDVAYSQCNDHNLRFRFVQDGSLGAVPMDEVYRSIPRDVHVRIALYSKGGTLLDTVGRQAPEYREVMTATCLMGGAVNMANISNYTYAPMKLSVSAWNR